MGGEATLLTAADARHLLRRTGFGAKRADVDRLVGRPRGAVVDELLYFVPSRFKPLGRDIDKRLNSWVRYMQRQDRLQLQEKLVLFWHDHFATSDTIVENHKLMANQNLLFRRHCKGSFKDLVKAVNKDAAMMEFLDTVRNHKEQPNENYARELQELFTLGVKDFAGNANYTQSDVSQIARAFTGWDYNGRGMAVFDENGDDHDYLAEFQSTRGLKTIYKSTGGFGTSGRDFAANGEGAAEIDTVVDIIFDHGDSDGHNTVARFIAGKLFAYFAQPAPKRQVPADVRPVVDALIAEASFDTSWDVGALLRAMFVNDAFYATAIAQNGANPPFGASVKKSVKWPVDFVVSTLRILGIRLFGRYATLLGGNYSSVHDHLEDMGQHLFEPPSVFGWDIETAWLSSSTLLARSNFGRDIAAARGSGSYRFRPQNLIDLDLTDPADIVDAVTDVLGVTDQFTAAERQLLIDYLTEGGTVSSLDLHDYDTRNEKLHGLFALVIQSPAYQLQ